MYNTIEHRPRLLIILNRFVIGGQAVDTIPLLWHLQSHFQIVILYGEKEKDEIEPLFLLEKYPGLQLKKIKNLRRSINPFNDFIAFIQVYSAIKNFGADIVHTHGAKSGFTGRIAAWLYGVPVIIHTFHGHFFHSYFSRNISKFIAGIERLVGKITTAAIALSDAQKKELSQVYKILPSHKIEVIPLGFAFDRENNAQTLRQQYRQRYNIQPADVAVGIVGRIVPVKNHAFFVRVVKNILQTERAQKTVFLIVGDGDMRSQVENDLQKQQIKFTTDQATHECRVIFTSWITDMYGIMNALDVIALTSLNEGTPLSVIEAQFFKKPVVSTNAGGVKDTMLDNVSGYITATNDEHSFTTKLQNLIDDNELRQQMGEAGFSFASVKFSKQNEIDAMRNFYTRLLHNKRK